MNAISQDTIGGFHNIDTSDRANISLRNGRSIHCVWKTHDCQKQHTMQPISF